MALTASPSGDARVELAPAEGLGAFVHGHVEAAYTYAFERPSNGIINHRGFDNLHNTFTIGNAVIDVEGKLGGLQARVALQVGRTPDTYYLAEPALAGSSTVGGNSPASWRFLQQARGGYRFPVAEGLTLDAGVYLSPVGLESMSAKEDWNYSRSNLFFALPFYHLRCRLSLDATPAHHHHADGDERLQQRGRQQPRQVGDRLRSSNNIPYQLICAVLYMGGPERARGAAEGQPFGTSPTGT